MNRICRECRKGTLQIVGMGAYEDTIIVECPECGESYEVEPDGLGEGGMEMLEAYEVEMKRRDEEDAEEEGEKAGDSQ